MDNIRCLWVQAISEQHFASAVSLLAHFPMSTMARPLARFSARKEKQRFRYSEHSRSGFIELEHDRFSADDLRQNLLGVAGVTYVVPHRMSKTEQGNASLGHAQQHNWKVMSETLRRLQCGELEFEITWNGNLSDVYLEQQGIPRTITVMFKETAPEAYTEAWRILSVAVRHLALFPEEVDAWISDITWKGLSLPTECVFHTYMDDHGMIWYSNADYDGDYFTQAMPKGWVRHVDTTGNYWWFDEAASRWFRERAGP